MKCTDSIFLNNKHYIFIITTFLLSNIRMEPAKGKLGVMCVGLGAVTTTFMTGVLMARKGLA